MGANRDRRADGNDKGRPGGHPFRRPAHGSSRRSSAFDASLLRSIRGSLGRFLAIMGIVALGCGFFAGLKMTGPDMRSAADAFYDGTALWDLRVISTMGFGDADVDRLAATEGVLAAMPCRTVDAMARLGQEQVAVRVSSLDVDAAQAASVEGDVVTSEDANYLNRPILREGRWPQASDECLVSADISTGPALGDRVEVLYGTDALDEELDERTFTVVGRVSASNYVYTGSFGSTNLGSGQIDDYLYVREDAFRGDAPYTEVYLKVEGADELESGSAAYQDRVGTVKERIEADSDALAQERQGDLRASAQERLDQKVADYQSAHDEAYGQLDQAKAQLDQAAAQIADGKSQLAQGQEDYEKGREELASQRTSAQTQLADAQEKIDAGRAQVKDQQGQLDAGEASWQAGFDQLAAGLAAQGIHADSAQGYADALASQLDKITQGRAQLAALKDQRDQAQKAAAALPQLEEALAQAQAALGQLDPDSQDHAQVQAQVAALKDQVDRARKAQGGLPQLETAVQEMEARLPSAQEEAALAQARETAQGLAQTRTRLDQGKDELDQARGKLDAGQRKLDQRRSQAQAQLDAAQARLDQAKAQLEASRAQLGEAQADYEEGLASYQASRAEADQEFADAWTQIQEAQDQIDDMDLPDLYTLDRTQSEGAATYQADTERMDHIANVFPFIFFLVAALVALTTMTRLVDDDRIQIGTLKALGYGKGRIAGRYLLYALLAAGIGAVAGIALLSQVLPLIITSSYAIIYTVPLWRPPLPMSWPIALGVGVTLLATWAAVAASLREAPATLMLPRVPKAGKRILLERVGPLWRRLSFSWKVTARNLFRYKRRLLMTVIGISGCTALLLVGFGLHDAIWDIIDLQYGPIVHYDTTIGLTDDANELDVRKVIGYLDSTGKVSGIVRVDQRNMQAEGTGASTSATEKTRVSVIVPQDAAQVQRSLTFKDRRSQQPIAFDGDAVVVTEKLASLHGIGVGDEIVLYDQDDVGNPTGQGHALRVTGVMENYVGNLVYVGRDAWRQVDAGTPTFSTIWCDIPDEGDARVEVAAGLHDQDSVSTVIFSDETINMYRNMLSVVNLVVVVLIVSAAALAAVVLYNLTNINVEERVREIATLKVLGFTRPEVYAYIFREIGLLALIGDVVGLFLGIWLENFVITTAEVDYVMFGRAIHPPSFAYAFALTLGFSALVMVAMRHKLDRVSMVESLKSVD